MQPPYQITPVILSLHSEISRLCGQVEGWELPSPKLELRRGNRIRAIQGSLAIEGNSLSLEQITAILEGRRVLGPKRDILEAQNAIRAYDIIDQYEPYSTKSFLKGHGILMEGLVENPGHWRQGNVGIQKGEMVSHVAPPAKRVPELMGKLFQYLKSDIRVSKAILSGVFHYETSFIHPFMDGNGRAARLWQSVLLRKHHPVFAFVPVESMVRRKQKEYYRALEASDKKGEATPFLEFMLAAIHDALLEFTQDMIVPARTPESRLQGVRLHFVGKEFSRKDYLARCKTISPATASRDLRDGVENGLLKKAGEKALTRYRFAG